MSQTREILTLQFGHYANYVGAHWWNIQVHTIYKKQIEENRCSYFSISQESGFTYDHSAEPAEICHDALYRQGVNHNVNFMLLNI